MRQLIIARARRIFCNRNLRMTNIAWVGFDMDYTLAIYDQPEMDRLSIEATQKKLVWRGYPEFVGTVPVSIDFPVRGLLIDKRFGHVLKMDRYKVAEKGYHGTRQLTRDELRELYQSKKLRPATPRYHWIDTLYALSEVATYAALVDAMEKKGYAVDYAKLFTDIRECIDEAHRDGTILDEVMNNLPHFVHRDQRCFLRWAVRDGRGSPRRIAHPNRRPSTARRCGPEHALLQDRLAYAVGKPGFRSRPPAFAQVSQELPIEIASTGFA